MQVKKKIRILKPVRGYKAGSVIAIKVDEKSGLPIDRYWRERHKDSLIDNCIEYVTEEQKQVDPVSDNMLTNDNMEEINND